MSLSVPVDWPVDGPGDWPAGRKAAGDRSPLRVAVLVDLTLEPDAGGHVKCWQRLAAAAVPLDGGLDLTVHFSGARPAVQELSRSVRFMIHPPRFSTARLGFLSHIPDHTDIAPSHPGLARQLTGCDVIHTTDAYFAFARTALTVAGRTGIPLVNSIHTDTPRYTRLFTRQTVERVAGRGLLGRVLLDRLGVDAWAGRNMAAKLARYQKRCDFVLVSRPDQRRELQQTLAAERVGILRRGVERALFCPEKCDRARLEAEFAIPPGRVIILTVGRLNAGKNVVVVAQAVRHLLDHGQPVHLLCAGDGSDRAGIQALLGDHASCPGVIEPARLARAYASADLLAMPSQIEVFANAVVEALASGLPVAVAAAGGMAELLPLAEAGVVVAGSGPEPWQRALAALVANPERRRRMAAAARRLAARELPGWDDVLAQDLLPVWRTVAASRAAAGKPDFGRPDLDRPDFDRPDFDRPDYGRLRRM